MLTKQYYNVHASEFIESTFNVDLRPIYTIFESYLEPGQKILDIGFGSGRDTLHFTKQGYVTVSIDYAEEIVNRGKNLLNSEVLHVDFRDMKYENEFHAIWASAVFLHFNEDVIIDALNKCYRAMKTDGVIYLSFKYGEKESFRHGRFFNDFDEAKFNHLLTQVDGFECDKMWVTEDMRPSKKGRHWLNVILKKV